MDTKNEEKMKDVTSIAEFDFDPLKSNFNWSENLVSNHNRSNLFLEKFIKNWNDN